MVRHPHCFFFTYLTYTFTNCIKKKCFWWESNPHSHATFKLLIPLSQLLKKIITRSLQRSAGATTSPRFSLYTILDVFIHSDCGCCSGIGVSCLCCAKSRWSNTPWLLFYIFILYLLEKKIITHNCLLWEKDIIIVCKNTHRYFGVNFLKRHLKRNRGSIILRLLLQPTPVFSLLKTN